MDIKLLDSYVYIQEIWCPPEEEDLFYYEACLAVENILNVTISLYKVIKLCHNCEPQFWTNILPETTERLLVPVTCETSFHYKDAASGLSSCVVNYRFVQHGYYSYTADFSCDEIEVNLPPDNPYTSVFFLATLLVFIWVLYMLFVFLHARKSSIVAYVKRRLRLSKNKKQAEKPQLETDAKAEEPESKSVVELRIIHDGDTGDEKVTEVISRGINTEAYADTDRDDWHIMEEKPLRTEEFDALLALRGLTVLGWVFLFVEGNTFVTFKESAWNGFRVADVPSGWFYWVLGASAYVRLQHGIASGQTRRRILFRSALMRCALYILGGFVYNNINGTSPRASVTRPLNAIRIFGVFQRAGLALIVPAAVEVAFARRKIKDGRFFGDILDGLPQWAVGIALAALQVCITYLMPVPGCPTGYTGPGGHTGHSHCTGGIAGHIDRSIFSETNLMAVEDFEGFKTMYKLKVPFDPQGLLGTLTTAFMMTSAMHAARIFFYFRHPLGRSARLLAWATVQLVLGGLLCGFSSEYGLVPSNPHLMSISYVLLASGFAYLALFMFYFLINVKGWWSGFPLIDAGISMMVVLFGNMIFQRTFPFQWMVTNLHTCTEFLIMAVWSVFVWCVVCYNLIHNRIICTV